MATVIKDVIDGNITESSDGMRQERVYLVHGLSGDGARRQWRALTQAGVPKLGEPHPFIPGIQVLERQAEPAINDNTIARVHIAYGIPAIEDSTGDDDQGAAAWSFSAELVSETTVVDVRGDKMITEYATLGAGSITLTTITHEVEVDRPLFTARARRTERRLNRDRSLEFSGKVNRARWSGFKPKTWLCRVAAEPNNKRGYDFEYIFHYRPETWVADLYTKVDGQIPINAILGNGRKRADVYEEADFNRLGLAIPA